MERRPWTRPYTNRERIILSVIGVWAAVVLGTLAFAAYGILHDALVNEAWFANGTTTFLKGSPMTVITALLSLVIAASYSVTAQVQPVEPKLPPFVMVQAVDASWSPMPGAQVVLQEQSGTRLTHTAVTNAAGFASFWLAPPDPRQSFDVSASLAGFRKGEMKDVRFGTCAGDCNSPRYIQLRLEVSGPLRTVR